MTNNTALAVFQFDRTSVRTCVDDHGEPWFVAADVCRILEISNVGNVLARLDTDEKVDIHTADAMGRMQPTAFINESGLYNLIFTSRKAEAKAFKKWVTSEVLPALRKTGTYTVPAAAPVPASPKTPHEFLAIAQSMLDSIRAEAEARERLESKVDSLAAQVSAYTTGTDYFSIKAYCKLRGYRIPLDTAKALGRQATKRSHALGYEIGQTTDQTYGTVGTYHTDILIAVVDEYFGVHHE